MIKANPLHGSHETYRSSDTGSASSQHGHFGFSAACGGVQGCGQGDGAGSQYERNDDTPEEAGHPASTPASVWNSARAGEGAGEKERRREWGRRSES